MSYSSMTGTGESAEPAQEGLESSRTEIDLQALAEKIYRLLKEEARLERERLGRRDIW
jgi:hypothetical protein